MFLSTTSIGVRRLSLTSGIVASVYRFVFLTQDCTTTSTTSRVCGIRKGCLEHQTCSNCGNARGRFQGSRQLAPPALDCSVGRVGYRTFVCQAGQWTQCKQISYQWRPVISRPPVFRCAPDEISLSAILTREHSGLRSLLKLSSND